MMTIHGLIKPETSQGECVLFVTLLLWGVCKAHYTYRVHLQGHAGIPAGVNMT